jgi:polyferredoxin
VFAILPALPLGKIVSGMGLHPSPMCIVTKPFLFLNAGRDIPLIFLSLLTTILILTVIGNKLFCGWACPIGAIQEIVYRIPLPRKFKIKLPFKITNIIRSAAFILFIPLVFLIGLSIYDYFNPFEFLHWRFELYGLIAILIVLAGSLFIFRPFCYLFCPLGLITWLFEHISLAKIKVNHELCTDCNICVDDSPCPSMESILNQKKIIPDCHACGECLPLCPENAIEFKR